MSNTLPPQQTWPLGEAIYRQFLDSFVDEMYLHDDQGVLLDVNPAACQSLGYTRAELLGMCTCDFSAACDAATLLQLWRDHPVGRNVLRANVHRRKDGSTYHVDMHIACQEHGGRKYFLALARHTDDKHRRESEILQLNEQLENVVQERTRMWQESSRLLEAVMNQTPDSVFIKDMDGRYQYMNRALLQQLGLSATEILGRTDAELFPPALAREYRQSDLDAIASNDVLMFETQAYVNGRSLHVNVMKTPYRDEEGRTVGLMGMTRDISHIRQTQEQLERNYEMLRQAERIARIGSWTLDLATNTFSSSDMLAQMNGCMPDDPPLTPQSLQTMIPAEDHAKLSAAIQECIAHGTPYSLDVQHRLPSGGYFPGRIRGQAYRNASGQIVMLHGTLQDLSEHVEARERLASLADNLPNGAIFRCEQVGPDRLKLSYVSAGVQRLLGISSSLLQATETTFTRAIHPDDVGIYLRDVKASLHARQPFDTLTRVRHASGEYRWIRTRATPRNMLGKTLWEGLLLDVTQEHEAQQALQAAKEAAEAAEKIKSEFLATMSHEIRTPMNTVIGMTQLLQQTQMTHKQRNYIDKVALSASALLAIINDILDFSRLEADMLSLAPEPFMLDTLLETVSAVTSLRAEQKGLEVVYAVDASVPRQLLGDAQRLSQVLTNLVGNAIKFTDRGEVVVTISARRDSTSNDPRSRWLEVSVRDTGIGMRSDHMAQLFQPFTQAEAYISRRYGGTGLGLAISRRLVQMMGGDITVHSEWGQGSEFRFEARVQAESTVRAKRLLDATPCKVLVVDDNPMARDILSGMVQGFGLRCDTAESGPQALQLLEQASLQQQPYRMVLMDWRMPGMDGLEVAQRIRQHDQLADTPAMLMVTAYCRDEVLDQLSALGMQGLLVKPVTESALFNAMHDALHDQGLSLESPKIADGPEHDRLQVPAALRGARILVVDDNALNREVARDFLELASIQVTTASTGKEALALLQTQRFELVLLDVQMPEMDGLEVARRIRLQPDLLQLPVIALTAQARTEDRLAILASGMNGHLTKPLDARLLFDTVCQAMGVHAEPAARPVQAAIDSATDLPTRAPVSAILTPQLARDPARAQRLLQSFLRDFDEAPAQLRALSAAKDWSALNMLAHTLKGSIGYLNAPAAVAALQTVEHACSGRQSSIVLPARELDNAATMVEHVIAQVRSALEIDPPSPTPDETLPDRMKTAHCIDWIEQALPRIQRGDYAGVQLLEELEVRLRYSQLHGLAARALALAEDLDNEAACDALQQLHAALALAPQ